jgi:ribose 5-phosphate isomerase A
MLSEKEVEAFVAKFIENGQVLGIGSSELGEHFLKKIALKKEEENLELKIVATSAKIAAICKSLHLPTVSLNETEIDLAIEFASMVDEDFNFIKKDSHSLVRDKMIAQSAETMIVVSHQKFFVKKLIGVIPFEIIPFGFKRTIIQLENLGSARLRMSKGIPLKTESGNFLVDVLVDQIYDLEDLEFQAKEIPGVIETGLFLNYADKAILAGDVITVKSRIRA